VKTPVVRPVTIRYRLCSGARSIEPAKEQPVLMKPRIKVLTADVAYRSIREAELRYPGWFQGCSCEHVGGNRLGDALVPAQSKLMGVSVRRDDRLAGIQGGPLVGHHFDAVVRPANMSHSGVFVELDA
jgi:hypothetical protein